MKYNPYAVSLVWLALISVIIIFIAMSVLYADASRVWSQFSYSSSGDPALGSWSQEPENGPEDLYTGRKYRLRTADGFFMHGQWKDRLIDENDPMELPVRKPIAVFDQSSFSYRIRASGFALIAGLTLTGLWIWMRLIRQANLS